MAKPAARLTDPSKCPLPGHGTNAIATGSPDVFFDGLAAARQGDTCSCGSALVTGLSSTVFINGKNAATIDTGGTHGSVVIGGSGTVIIGDSHSSAPFTPPLPLSIQKTYSQTFSILDSETGKPLAGRNYIALIDGKQINGVTDGNGLARIKTAIPNAMITLQVGFEAPARALDEFMD